MAELREIVKDMIDRVKVDLAGDELVGLLAIFDLPQWANNGQRLVELRSAAEQLAKILKLQTGLVKDFVLCAKMLTKLRQAAQANSLQLSNREAWSLVLIPEWRCKFCPKHSFQHLESLSSMVCFYLALKVNTTTLERNLGDLCRQLAAHSGPTDERTVAALLEVALDGPSKERGVFYSHHDCSSASHRLVPTEFARNCAKMWVQCFGRRFQYKYKQADSSKPKEKRRARGSFAALQQARGEAMNALSRACDSAVQGKDSIPSFVPELTLPLPPDSVASAALDGTRWSAHRGSNLAEASGSGKRKHPSQLFRDHTARKRARS